MNIVFLDTKTIGEAPNLAKLQSFGNVTFFPSTSKKEVKERVKEADVIITNKVIINQETIDSASRLKLICIAATGTNNVDLSYAAQKGIPVKNAVGYSTKSVAQSTFCTLLALIHQIGYYDGYVKSGKYCESDIFTHINHDYWELSGKTFGIVGLGNIGREVAKIANAFGARVIYYSASGANYHSEFERVDLQALLERSDVVSIHAPLNNYTAGLINLHEIRSMKRDAILINMGRGGIVNEHDVAHALDENLIGGAILDVFETEPMGNENPLLNIANKHKLLLTPHIAWASIEARTKLVEIICDHIKSLEG